MDDDHAYPAWYGNEAGRRGTHPTEAMQDIQDVFAGNNDAVIKAERAYWHAFKGAGFTRILCAGCGNSVVVKLHPGPCPICEA